MINNIINYLFKSSHSTTKNNNNPVQNKLKNSIDIDNLLNSINSNNSEYSGNSSILSDSNISNNSSYLNNDENIQKSNDEKKEIINLLNQHCSNRIDNNINFPKKNLLYSRLIISNIIFFLIGYTCGKKK